MRRRQLSAGRPRRSDAWRDHLSARRLVARMRLRQPRMRRWKKRAPPPGGPVCQALALAALLPAARGAAPAPVRP
eukprot:scaffold5365_cov115-Isochrysis_galbana.AAC.9